MLTSSKQDEDYYNSNPHYFFLERNDNMSVLNLGLLDRRLNETKIPAVKNVFDMNAVEETYFITALKSISETNEYINESTKVLYKNILESGQDEELIHESFSDFFQKVKAAIDKFIQFIKSLVDRFVISLHKFVLSDKFINKNKDKLSKFIDDWSFEIQGYNYTFSDSIPKINASAEFKKEFVGIDFDEMIKENTPEATMKYIQNKYNQLKASLNGDYYDKFRQDVIGAKTSIRSEDFQSDLSQLYRDGADSKENIKVNSSKVTECLGRFENYKDLEKQVKKTKKEIEDQYKNIEDDIKDLYTNGEVTLKNILIKINGDYDGSVQDVTLSKDASAKLDLFIKTKVNQVAEMSNIHSLAFTAKLDAMSDCYKQDKQILYKAIQIVEKKTWKDGAK